ncbi:MAG: hypothetical protein JNL38_08450 [Myxococcales bacterium]|nr:hypothetical protein [Myxococcales bacterium]
MRALATTLTALACAAALACGATPAPPAPAPVPSAAPAASGSACPDDEAYTPRAAWSGKKPTLPPVPALPSRPARIGADYTVYGAVHALHSRIEEREVTSRPIVVVGYIADTNLARAPKCALHPAGKRSPDGCVTEIPAFVLADERAPDAAAPRIRALGWASNFPQVFEASQRYKGLKAPPAKLYEDPIWAVGVPFPLPAPGAKVRVRGTYGFSFTKSSTGITTDPDGGILTVESVETLEPAPEPAKLGPG